MEKNFKFKKYGINIEMGMKLNKGEPEVHQLNELIQVDGKSFRVSRAYKTMANEFMHVKNDYVLTFELEEERLSLTPGDFKLKDDEGKEYPYYFANKDDESLLVDKKTNKVHFDVKVRDRYYLMYSPYFGEREIIVEIDSF
ncbi:hypothetical protein B4127_1610 [Bacillus pumilus]|uniref:DUF1934 domain-containing protein n=1 Tax=Bacillus pumilus TaxID=1408 RepID=A0AB34QQD7_BACPU|nr:hypothetical protein [Bacillus pumilus]KIL12279.1 hypothetical protein B4127_1610 [Bacillus pumilus]